MTPAHHRHPYRSRRRRHITEAVRDVVAAIRDRVALASRPPSRSATSIDPETLAALEALAQLPDRRTPPAAGD